MSDRFPPIWIGTDRFRMILGLLDEFQDAPNVTPYEELMSNPPYGAGGLYTLIHYQELLDKFIEAVPKLDPFFVWLYSDKFIFALYDADSLDVLRIYSLPRDRILEAIGHEPKETSMK